MPIFAGIALAVVMCASGGECEKLAPETWESASIAEVAQDWNECKALEKVYQGRPGIQSATCRYTQLAGVASL